MYQQPMSVRRRAEQTTVIYYYCCNNIINNTRIYLAPGTHKSKNGRLQDSSLPLYFSLCISLSVSVLLSSPSLHLLSLCLLSLSLSSRRFLHGSRRSSLGWTAGLLAPFIVHVRAVRISCLYQEYTNISITRQHISILVGVDTTIINTFARVVTSRVGRMVRALLLLLYQHTQHSNRRQNCTSHEHRNSGVQVGGPALRLGFPRVSKK